MIRALVFDFDGLILDTELSLIDAYDAVHADHGVAFDRERLRRNVGHADTIFDPWHAFDAKADRVALEVERRRRNRERDHLLPVMPGVVPILDAAREAGLKLGVASNSRHSHVEGHLGRLGLLDRFAFVACREDVPSPKPEPDLYRLVLNRFGLTGNAAIAFEDSHTGALAARRANLWTVAVPNASTIDHDFSHASLVVPTLADVKLAELMAKFGNA